MTMHPFVRTSPAARSAMAIATLSRALAMMKRGVIAYCTSTFARRGDSKWMAATARKYTVVHIAKMMV